MDVYVIAALSLILYCEVMPGLAQEDIRHPPNIDQPSFVEIRYFHSSAPINISCHAQGTPTPRYMWLKDGMPIDSMYTQVDPETGMLWVEKATRREQGAYTCHANNTWGTAVSHNINMVNIYGGSFVQTPPTEVSKETGESLSLTCRNPPISVPEGRFSWYTVPLTTSGSSSEGANGIILSNRTGVDEKGTLHFAYLDQSDNIPGKNYACAVQNYKTETISLGSKVRLTVKDKTIEQFKPTSLYTSGTKKEVIGTKAKLECFFSANPLPKIQWYRNNKVLKTGGRIALKDFNRRLEIANVSESDMGRYKCNGSNLLGHQTKDLNLIVISKPIWVQPPVSQTVVEGSNVTFFCKAKSAKNQTPPRDPVWFQNGEKLPQNDTRITNPQTFRLFQVSRDEDIMNVQCMVENEFGTIFQDAFLNVLLPISITNQPPSSVRIAHSDVIHLYVSATTDPSQTLLYQWKHRGAVITLPRDGFTLTNDHKNLTINTSMLAENEMDTVLGLYTCIISNEKEIKVIDIYISEIEEEGPVTEGVVVPQEAGTSWWILAVVLGILLLIGAAVLVACVLRQRYPKRVYLLEKKELKNKLDPVRDVENDYFQTM